MGVSLEEGKLPSPDACCFFLGVILFSPLRVRSKGSGNALSVAKREKKGQVSSDTHFPRLARCDLRQEREASLPREKLPCLVRSALKPHFFLFLVKVPGECRERGDEPDRKGKLTFA